MSARTRSKAPANRVFSSPAAQQQVSFKPRKQRVAARHNLGTVGPSRQETLTQMDFVNLQQAMNDDEDIYDEEQPARKRRRRTEGDAPSSASKFHTQTLTQLEFVSTPSLRREGLSDEENDFRIPSSYREHAKIGSPVHNMGPPKTPSRRRIYEVPSSQSPSSPASVRSRRPLLSRSPLKAMDINQQIPAVSPTCRVALRRSPKVKLEIADTFEYENGSQQSRVPQTPTDPLSPVKPSGSFAEQQPTIGTQRIIKDEIQDSDEENDEDLETYYDDLVPESQARQDVLNPVSSDTQEAEEQLHSTIVQFTQPIPFTTEEAAAPPRPSQATTVSLSQPPSSSPLWSRRTQPNHPQHARAMEALDTQPGEAPILVPDSPSQQLWSADIDLSLSPTLPRLPIETQEEIQKSINRTEDIPVPFSITSSQLLTRSQMLPESLMNDSVPPPPLFIDDSDLDEDE
jgi:hypothetical protein